MTEYARSAVVYRELRTAFQPWCKEQGYKRQPRSDANWMRPVGGEDLIFGFRVNAWGSGQTGGNSFHGTLQTEPKGAGGSAINRQCDLSLCLVQAELDELRLIQNAINKRRPGFPERDEWMREDSGVGEATRAQYKQFAPGEQPYVLGDFATFSYYSVADVRVHIGFLVKYLPGAIARFLDGRQAPPTPRPQPEWLEKLTR